LLLLLLLPLPLLVPAANVTLLLLSMMLKHLF